MPLRNADRHARRILPEALSPPHAHKGYFADNHNQKKSRAPVRDTAYRFHIIDLFVTKLHVLYINGFLDFFPSLDRWFHESLPGAELAESTGFLEFPFEFLKSLFNVFALFYWYNNHLTHTSFYSGVQS